MAARKASVKLSEQRQAGAFKCYRKMIGGRLFYFSQDRGESERMAMALSAAWRQLSSQGTGWTEDAVSNALALAGFTDKAAPRLAVGAQRVHSAVDDYLAEYRARVSPSRYQRHVVALNDYKRQQPDMPLRLIGWNKLQATVEHYRARPVTSHGAPMAVATVQTTLKAVLAFYDWCDVSGRWESPRRFEKLFRVKFASLRTPLEVRSEGNGPDVFTIAELKTLWESATERQRLYIGLSLNTGETAGGLAGLQKADIIVSQTGQRIIDRHRSKTGVRGVYPLWAPVSALVESQGDQSDDETLAFRTMNGKPLVWYPDSDKVGRVDTVAKTWTHLLKRCPTVRPLGFAALRKTGASIILDLTGSVETAQTYLSHRGSTVAEKHYLVRSFDRLADALSLMHDHLSPMFSGASAPRTVAA